MKNKFIVLGFVAIFAAGMWLPGASYAQTAANNLGITPGMSDAQIIQVLTQVVTQLLQQIQTIIAQRTAQTGYAGQKGTETETETETGNSSALITVSYPAAGVTLDNSGSKSSGLIANIQWADKGVAGQTVGITLLNASGNIVKIIADGVPDTGNYAWAYDSSIPNGSYQISVSIDGKGSASGLSGVFTLTGNEVGSATPSSVQSSPVTVLYPAAGVTLDNSGSKSSGLIANIQWADKGVAGQTVGITLLNASGNIVKIIADGVPDTGNYAWAYDSSIPNGSYQISVSIDGKGSASGLSGVFTLTGNGGTSAMSAAQPLSASMIQAMQNTLNGMSATLQAMMGGR